ncbi:flagellar basal body-associated FliL family protein [Amphritea sp. 2_MG-2023]|jgi:flagellar FliL protein|uniref:flagellar basal body-associated FliL family protein n=1 Tax=Amphritea TaxID=515417 RepID=UPI001C073811|nr:MULTISPECIES: flagellar basal body-associated FliL family protein [Amphritea]MBU2967112.1 flagellar basal body-associated FliL family protein [Amphritea atlantica]MDO6419335.1 flagellar basal body-associated FliL family protein [Amphritea sp. 2_MG-2023]MDX2421730.1 flagellar basal body-associated FliL family protein [Amphritea sp.]
MLKRFLLVLFLGAMLQPVWAADEPSAEDYVNYIELKPFVANFVSPGTLRFLKCEITIQVTSAAAHHAVNYHMAEIRHEVLMLLSSKTEEELKTVDKQHILAQEALEKVQRVLLAEEGEAYVADLFFTSFVLQ